MREGCFKSTFNALNKCGSENKTKNNTLYTFNLTTWFKEPRRVKQAFENKLDSTKQH